jgi:transcriptional regulator of arginine metabolism
MRKKRLSEILSIIRESEIENQDMLICALKARGFDVTQATVSRDINELNLEKSLSENGVVRYAKRSAGRSLATSGVFAQAVESADYALNTVVLKCRPGWAGAACDAFEQMNFPQTVGSIAGDDTVFVLARTEKDAKDLCEKVFAML